MLVAAVLEQQPVALHFSEWNQRDVKWNRPDDATRHSWIFEDVIDSQELEQCPVMLDRVKLTPRIHR